MTGRMDQIPKKFDHVSSLVDCVGAIDDVSSLKSRKLLRGFVLMRLRVRLRGEFELEDERSTYELRRVCRAVDVR
jgi:hypothetical protein